MRKSGSGFMEYIIIIGVISAGLIAMNAYIKRGMQARLKEMTDFFISNEQLAEITPVNSAVNTTVTSGAIREVFSGGGQRLQLNDAKNISSTLTATEQEEIAPADAGTFVPSEDGVPAPPIPSPS